MCKLPNVPCKPISAGSIADRHLRVLGNFYFSVSFFFFFLDTETKHRWGRERWEISSYRPFRLDEMQFVLSKSWWISNTRVTLWYSPNIRRHLVSDRSNFSPDRHFLPPDVWPLYSNLSKQREGEGLQGDPEGPWGVAGVGGGEGHRQKTPAHVTWASANRAATSRSAATRKANKGNVATPPGAWEWCKQGRQCTGYAWHRARRLLASESSCFYPRATSGVEFCIVMLTERRSEVP